MIENNKEKDLQTEKVVHKYLEENFYFQYTTNYTGYEDLEHQYAGIDTTFNYDSIDYVCDEKATFSPQWLNKELPTLCLDILTEEYTNGGRWLDGWFMDNTHKNDSLLYCYDFKTEKKEIESVEDIDEMKICLVPVENIWEYIYDCGWDKHKLNLKATEIMYNCKGKNWDFVQELNSNNVSFCQVGNIKENGLKFRYNMAKNNRDNVILQIPVQEMRNMAVLNKILRKK